MTVILSSWKDKEEFYDVASYMKNKYTSIFLQAYESESHLDSMEVIMNEAKLATTKAPNAKQKRRICV